MYWLVENEEQLNVLLNSSYKEAFIEVIPYSDNIHPAINPVSLVYIRPLKASKGFMICSEHSESLNVLNTRICGLIDKFDKLFSLEFVNELVGGPTICGAGPGQPHSTCIA